MKKAFNISVFISSIVFFILALLNDITELPRFLILNSIYSKLPIYSYNALVISDSALQMIFAVFCLIRLFNKKRAIEKTGSIILFVLAIIVIVAAMISSFLNGKFEIYYIVFSVAVLLVGIDALKPFSKFAALPISIFFPALIFIGNLFSLKELQIGLLIFCVAYMLLFAFCFFILLYHSLKKNENTDRIMQ